MRRELLSVFLLLHGLLAMAQTVQPGIVREYNERLKKTPLAGVEIIVANAPSTVSDKKGHFNLEFRTLKPGNKVNVRRIEKLGYEIFNKEALEQWYVSGGETPYNIVMCRSDRFKRIRDNYSQLSSENYARQMQKEQDHLAAERRAGRLKEEEYQEAIRKLNKEYDSQLDRLENYVDRFARIDLSELSNSEAKIIELVQKGEIERAIDLYTNLNLEMKYKKEVENRKKIQKAVDAVMQRSYQNQSEILKSVFRKNEMLMLAGGKENFEKINQSLKELVDIDTTNVYVIHNYIMFLLEQNRYDDAPYYCDLAVRHCKNLSDSIGVFFSKTNLHTSMSQFDMAEKCFLITQECIEKKRAMKDNSYNDDYGKLLINSANNYVNKNQFDVVLERAMKAKEIFESMPKDPNGDRELHLVMANQYIGLAYQGTGNLEKAESYFDDCLQRMHTIMEKNPKEAYSKTLSTIESAAGLTKEFMGKYEEADSLLRASLQRTTELTKINPDAYEKSIPILQNQVAVLHLMTKNYAEAEKFGLMAVESIEALQTKYKDAFWLQAAAIFGDLALIYEHQDKVDQAEPLLLKSQALYEQHPEGMEYFISVNHTNMAYVHLIRGDVDKAMQLVEQAMAADPANFAVYEMKGQVLLKMGDREGAESMWQKTIELNPYADKNFSKLYKQLHPEE